ncbi:MAG: hypothetical protein JNN27_09000 [Planctomycetes bacterium]|nr:hypothetical protein [Planctomycetota bacterium]
MKQLLFTAVIRGATPTSMLVLSFAYLPNGAFRSSLIIGLAIATVVSIWKLQGQERNAGLAGAATALGLYFTIMTGALVAEGLAHEGPGTIDDDYGSRDVTESVYRRHLLGSAAGGGILAFLVWLFAWEAWKFATCVKADHSDYAERK